MQDLFHKRKKNIKKTNKGFSLIEVLLAVVLLALVAAPILQMLYSSYAMNIKSRKYLAAADLAQEKMESLSSCVWEDSQARKGTAKETGLQNNTSYFPAGTTDFSAPITGTENQDGYTFKTRLTFDVPEKTNYYTVGITYEVMDPKTDTVICKTSTKILNKR